MGMADKATKNYMLDEDIFADAFNYYIFNGEKVVHGDALCSVDTASLIGILLNGKEEKKKTEYVQKYRDILKQAVIHQDAHATYVLLGIEAQTAVHYAMPVRNMLYDALQYAVQVDTLKTRHRVNGDKGTSEEFLSGMHKEDRLLPVVTLIIYFSPERWLGARRLSDILDKTCPELEKYVQDYELSIIEPAILTDEDFEKFSTDLKEVLKFIKYSGDKEKMKELLQKDSSYKNLKRKAAEVLSICAGLALKTDEEEEMIDVCKAWDDHAKEYAKEQVREAMIKNIVEMALEFNATQETIVTKLCEKLGLSTEEAEQEYENYIAAAS